MHHFSTSLRARIITKESYGPACKDDPLSGDKAGLGHCSQCTDNPTQLCKNCIPTVSVQKTGIKELGPLTQNPLQTASEYA